MSHNETRLRAGTERVTAGDEKEEDGYEWMQMWILNAQEGTHKAQSTIRENCGYKVKYKEYFAKGSVEWSQTEKKFSIQKRIKRSRLNESSIEMKERGEGKQLQWRSKFFFLNWHGCCCYCCVEWLEVGCCNQTMKRQNLLSLNKK